MRENDDFQNRIAVLHHLFISRQYRALYHNNKFTVSIIRNTQN